MSNALEKPVDAPLSATEKAIRDYLSAHKTVLGRMVSSHFLIQTLDEAQKLATLLASHCPAPEKVSTGIWELISNGVEHGNLEIDFHEKAKLIQDGTYTDEIERRCNTQPFADRMVSVEFKRTKTMIRLRVIDQGPGFNYEKFCNGDFPLDGPNGRGILIAQKFCFNKLTYRGRGNMVEAVIKL